jgi:hypothetical protein
MGLARQTRSSASSFAARFLEDADGEAQQQAWQRTTAQAVAAFMTRTWVAGWDGVDSTYIVGGQDRNTSVDQQRFPAAPRPGRSTCQRGTTHSSLGPRCSQSDARLC